MPVSRPKIRNSCLLFFLPYASLSTGGLYLELSNGTVNTLKPSSLENRQSACLRGATALSKTPLSSKLFAPEAIQKIALQFPYSGHTAFQKLRELPWLQRLQTMHDFHLVHIFRFYNGNILKASNETSFDSDGAFLLNHVLIVVARF